MPSRRQPDADKKAMEQPDADKKAMEQPAADKKAMEQPAAEEVTEEKKFSLEEIRKSCMKLFHVTSSTFAGATADLPDGEYSIQEVQEHIKAWLEKEV